MSHAGAALEAYRRELAAKACGCLGRILALPQRQGNYSTPLHGNPFASRQEGAFPILKATCPCSVPPGRLCPRKVDFKRTPGLYAASNPLPIPSPPIPGGWPALGPKLKPIHARTSDRSSSQEEVILKLQERLREAFQPKLDPPEMHRLWPGFLLVLLLSLQPHNLVLTAMIVAIPATF